MGTGGGAYADGFEQRFRCSQRTWGQGEGHMRMDLSNGSDVHSAYVDSGGKVYLMQDAHLDSADTNSATDRTRASDMTTTARDHRKAAWPTWPPTCKSDNSCASADQCYCKSHTKECDSGDSAYPGSQTGRTSKICGPSNYYQRA